MPYVEIIGPRADAANKQILVGTVTDGIAGAFGVSPSIVTVYFLSVDTDDYGHEGHLGFDRAGARVFVKVHAYRRSLNERRAVAAALTQPVAACFDTPVHNVAVYFLDRESNEVAHGGRMACDG